LQLPQTPLRLHPDALGLGAASDTPFAAQTLEGAAIPVGGESEPTVRILPPQSPQANQQEQKEMAAR
jgi:hypothetical protein